MRLPLGFLLYNGQVLLLEDEDLFEGERTVYISIASQKLLIRRIGGDGKLQCESDYDAIMQCNLQ